jgi:hypothetical protein
MAEGGGPTAEWAIGVEIRRISAAREIRPNKTAHRGSNRVSLAGMGALAFMRRKRLEFHGIIFGSLR